MLHHYSYQIPLQKERRLGHQLQQQDWTSQTPCLSQSQRWLQGRVYEGYFQIAFNNITIMGMNKIDEHKYIELEHNNKNIINKIDEQP